MRLEEIVKYRSATGKPHRVGSVTYTLYRVRLAQKRQERWSFQFGSNCMLSSMAYVYSKLNKEGQEKLWNAIQSIMNIYRNRLDNS